MAYNEFAYWYDELNSEADYDALAAEVIAVLRKNGVREGIVADLGCGTGEMSLRLARAGYDLISIDVSEDMLGVFREKLMETDEKTARNILLLCQDVTKLDLYGTIRAAVCTFDTFNHLSSAQLQQALTGVSLFMEPGGVLVFDANTPYKHREILGKNQFTIELEDAVCIWENKYNPAHGSVQIHLQVSSPEEILFTETFTEYTVTQQEWEHLLQASGFVCHDLRDGETFGLLTPESQRFLFTAVKQGNEPTPLC